MLLRDRDRVVFTGDSVTDAGRARPIGQGLWDGVGNGFVRQVDNFLNVLYPEQKFYLMNTGVSGNTTRDLFARWQTDVLDLKPDVLFVCIGFNDVWRQFDTPCVFDLHVPIEEYRENLIRMIRETKDKVRQMVFLTPYYMEPNKEDAMRKMMDAYGSVVKEVCKEYDLPCVDLQPAFDDYLQYRHSASLMWDRVHPGPIGSLLIARELLKFMGVDRSLF